MYRKHVTRRGMTLTETLLALLVVGMAGAAFSAMFPTAGIGIGRARHLDMATESAYREIDAWRAVGYRSPIATDTTDPDSRLASVKNGAAISAPPRITLPGGLPRGTITVALRRLDSGQFTSTTPAPASPTANYPAISPLGNGESLANFRCQIDVEVSWTGIRSDAGTVRVTSLLVEDPLPLQ